MIQTCKQSLSFWSAKLRREIFEIRCSNSCYYDLFDRETKDNKANKIWKLLYAVKSRHIFILDPLDVQELKKIKSEER